MTIEKMITPYNRDVKSARDIKYLVFHYTGTLAAAWNNAKYYASAKIGASAHYYLDETPIIYQGVEDKDVAWHCGGVTVYKHPDCRNANSIGVEMVPKKLSTKTMSAADTDWYFAPETVDNAVVLGRMLMAKYNIPIERVLRHYDVTGKICPNPFVVEKSGGGDTPLGGAQGMSPLIGKAAWSDFKVRLIKEEDEEMSYETFCGYMKQFEDERAAKPVDAWAKDAWDKAVAAGVFDGSAPLGNLTREQAALVMARIGGVTA